MEQRRAFGGNRAIGPLTGGILAAALSFAALLPAVGSEAPAPGTGSAPAAEIAEGYADLPLAFAPTASGPLDYAAAGDGGSVMLGSRGAVIVPASPRAEPLRMSLHGAAAVEPRAMQKLPGVVNDLRGDDPSRWRTEVPTFQRVRYAGVYPGTALDFHGTTGTLEYDFRLAPGADPGRIAVGFGGAPLRVTDRGALVVGSGAGRVRQAPPVAYQPSSGGREPVEARFAIDGYRVGFELGAYDRSRPLVIDPLFLSYSTFLGGPSSATGSGDDRAKAIAIDSSGNAYVAGETNSRTFPTTSGAYDQTPSNEQTYGTDAFVTKLNPTGTAVVYSTYLGGFYSEAANGIAVDGSGNAYVTGQTDSTRTDGSDRFPTTSGAFVSSGNNGIGDVFVTKLNPTGSGLVYSSVFGGTGTEQARGIEIDSAGNAYVAGAASQSFSAPNFPTTAGAYQTTYGGNSGDGFVTKLNSTGSTLVYSTLLGGTGQDGVNGIAIDSAGRAYVAGFSTAFSGNDFPTTAANRFAAVDPNSTDAFLTRFSADGTSLEYSTGIGTDGSGSNDGSDAAMAVALGPVAGTAYITGTSSTTGQTGADFPLKNQYEGRDGSCCFGNDLFVSEFDTNQSGANSLVYSTLIGGSGTEAGLAIAVDGDGSAYIGGNSENASGTKYDTTADALGTPSTRGSAIVTKVVQSGANAATLGFSTTIPNGGFAGDSVTGIALDETTGDVYVSGQSTGNAPVQTTAGAFQGSHSGEDDGFVSKIAMGTPPPDTTPPVTAIASGPANGSTVTSAQVSFGFSSNESGSTFECSYDGAGFAPCTSPGPGTTGSDSRTLAEGQHTFRVRARDASANVDASPEERTFTVDLPAPPPPPPPPPPDRTPPQTTITKAPPAKVKSKQLPVSVSVAFASSETGSTFRCSVDGGAAAACSSPATFKLAKGEHTISVAARDRAGNADASPATAEVKVEKKKRKKRKHGK